MTVCRMRGLSSLVQAGGIPALIGPISPLGAFSGFPKAGGDEIIARCSLSVCVQTQLLRGINVGRGIEIAHRPTPLARVLQGEANLPKWVL